MDDLLKHALSIFGNIGNNVAQYAKGLQPPQGQPTPYFQGAPMDTMQVQQPDTRMNQALQIPWNDPSKIQAMNEQFLPLIMGLTGPVSGNKIAKYASELKTPKNMDFKVGKMQVPKSIAETEMENAINRRIDLSPRTTQATKGVPSTGGEMPFSNLKPEQFTKEAINNSLDTTGSTPMNDMLFHVRQTKYTGDIPNTRGGIYVSQGQPFKNGQIYAIDKAKLDPSKLITETGTGYTKYDSAIPKDAYIYLGEWKPHEPMSNTILGEKIKTALQGSGEIPKGVGGVKK